MVHVWAMSTFGIDSCTQRLFRYMVNFNPLVANATPAGKATRATLPYAMKTAILLADTAMSQENASAFWGTRGSSAKLVSCC